MKEDRKVTKDGLKFMEVPEAFWLAERQSVYEIADGREWLEKYLEKWQMAYKKGFGIFLVGPRFSGKSYIAALLCKNFYAKWITPQWAYLPDMMDKMMKGLYWDSEEFETYESRYKDCDVLVMDSLGTEPHGLASKAANILQYRLDKRKVTILTTTLTPSEINERYGNDWASILKQCFAYLPLKVLDKRPVTEEF